MWTKRGQMSDQFISKEHLPNASSSAKRVNREVAKWLDDPDSYIQQNIHNISGYDYPVFAQANIRIQDKVGRSINLKFNRPQRQLWQWFLEDMAAGKLLRWYILKCRQTGISTWASGLFFWLSSLRPNRNCLIVAHEEDAVTNFCSRIRTMYAESHPSLKPTMVTDRSDLMHFGTKTNERKKGAGAGLDSRIAFMTADKKELGRSFNFHAVLLSEFGIWPNIGIDINQKLAALNPAIEEAPGTIIILETTAKGENAAKDFWDDPTNGYRKIFIPWTSMDEYRLESDSPLMASYPEYIDLGELCSSEEEAGMPTRYGNEILERELILDSLKVWYPEIPLDNEWWWEREVEARLRWRRYMIDKKAMGDKTAFRFEYPTIPAHAFSSTSRQCFDSGSLGLMRAHVIEQGIEPIRCNYIHDPEEEDPNRKFKQAPYGGVYFYELPAEKESYVLGGDPSMGLSAASDPSALIVLKVPDLEEVCSFNGIIPPEEFAEMAFYLGLLYNTALIGIEHNERGGAVVNNNLAKILRYPRLYYDRDPFTYKRSKTPGFVTTGANKSKMVADLAQLIRDHQILFRSAGLLDPVKGQLLHYEEHPDGSMGASKGLHDDFVSAALIATFLSTKVHQYPEPEPGIPKGSFAEAAEQIRMRNSRMRGLPLL